MYQKWGTYWAHGIPLETRPSISGLGASVIPSAQLLVEKLLRNVRAIVPRNQTFFAWRRLVAPIPKPVVNWNCSFDFQWCNLQSASNPVNVYYLPYLHTHVHVHVHTHMLYIYIYSYLFIYLDIDIDIDVDVAAILETFEWRPNFPQYLSARQALDGFHTTFSEAHVLLVQVEAISWQVALGEQILQFAHQQVFDHSWHKKIASCKPPLMVVQELKKPLQITLSGGSFAHSVFKSCNVQSPHLRFELT